MVSDVTASVLFLVVGVGAATATGEQPVPDTSSPPHQVEAVTAAVRALEEGKPGEALEHLEPLITDESDGIAAHSARLLHGQISGRFKQRQSVWLQRSVADCVVLVKDEHACLKALRQWGPEQFWPVLIEDGWFTPMFLEAFKPSTVLRWRPGRADQQSKLGVELQAFVVEHNRQFLSAGDSAPQPPGLVVIDPRGSLRLGGAALAVGRGQPIVLASSQFARQTVIEPEPLLAINRGLMAKSKDYGLRPGSGWMGLTLAVDFPYRFRMPPEAVKPVNHPAAGGLRATDDLLGRIPFKHAPIGVRAAVVGRLTGSPTQAVYQAMCSLFLQPENMLLIDTYKQEPGGGSFAAYDLQHAAELMGKRYTAELFSDKSVTLKKLAELMRPFNTHDMIWINSAGESSRWKTPDGWAKAEHFPIGKPTIMHVVHSHSLANAWNIDSLGGRAVAGGAYWYFGAMAEPYLLSFNTPTPMALKILAGTPLAFAARKVAGQQLSLPWRLMLIGDPLYALRDEPARRVAAPQLPGQDDPRLQFLRDGLLFDRMLAIDVALQLAKRPDDLEDRDLVRVASVLYGADRNDELGEIPDGTAQRHPMAAVLVRLSRLSQERKVSAGGAGR
jgi:hypothetical protein